MTSSLYSGPSGRDAVTAVMSVDIQREKDVLRRRASTPVRPVRPGQPAPAAGGPQRRHPPLGQSASYHTGDTSSHHYRARWSDDSDDDSECVHRVVLLGDHGVGKSSLAGIFAGISDKDEQLEEGAYERTLTVDGKKTTLVVMDTWTNDKLRAERARWCSTASSSRRRRRCSTTSASSLRAWCGKSACAAAERTPRPRGAGAPRPASARRASARRRAASWTAWWRATTNAWPSESDPRAAMTSPSFERPTGDLSRTRCFSRHRTYGSL
ncbi:GTP-binding protein REM 1 isoform X3 [Vanacampus margaritifer]